MSKDMNAKRVGNTHSFFIPLWVCICPLPWLLGKGFILMESNMKYWLNWI